MLWLKNNVTSLKRAKKKSNTINNQDFKRMAANMWSMNTQQYKRADVPWTIRNYENKLADYKNQKWLNDNRWQRADVYGYNNKYYNARINETEDELKKLKRTAKKRWY